MVLRRRKTSITAAANDIGWPGFVAACSCGWSEFRTTEERAERSLTGHAAEGCDAEAAPTGTEEPAPEPLTPEVAAELGEAGAA